MSKTRHGPPRPQPKGGRRARMVQPYEHETYRSRAKSARALRCTACGVFCHAGRWRWVEPTGVASRPATCPACRRIRDRFPVGTIRLPADLGAPRDEVLALIRHVEEQEKAEHPLERLMQVRDDGPSVVVTTTGIHLARRLAAALARRLPGRLRIRYAAEEHRVDVVWVP